MIPEGQAEFRKGRGAVDNIYTLNYVVEREIARRKKIVAIFINLKAAFDRELSIGKESRGERGKRLRESIMEIYEETRSVVKVEGIMGKKFWTERNVKQGCPLSPILFNLMIADIEEGLGG